MEYCYLWRIRGLWGQVGVLLGASAGSKVGFFSATATAKYVSLISVPWLCSTESITARMIFFGGGGPCCHQSFGLFSLVRVDACYGSICYCLVTEQELFDLGPCGFPLGYWWTHKCRNNSLSVVVAPIRLDVRGAWVLLSVLYRRMMLSSFSFQFQVVSQWVWCICCFGSELLPQSVSNLNLPEISMLLKEESSCGGLFDSDVVGVCTSVRTYILTLERGGRSGYLLLRPLVHMLKVMDDGEHVPYALWRGIVRVHYGAV